MPENLTDYDESLDLRTTDEIEHDAESRTALLREIMTGLPARPSTTR